MVKKIVIGVLSLSVLGAGGAALAYQAATRNDAAGQIAEAEQEQVQEQTRTATHGGDDQGQRGNGTQEQAMAMEMVGEPWTAEGTIRTLDDFGFTLALADGSDVYVELGPPAYWQAQGVTLSEGDSVTVEGFASGDQYHAASVTLENGQVLTVRSTDGMPLWSGGAGGYDGAGNPDANGLADGSHTPQPQAQVDEWVTVEGTITAMTQNTITLQTTGGETLTVQAGQPRFMASQGVTFQIGDEVSVLGFYGENGQFVAAEITQLSTGLSVMLRDPNGRPLWAGPGAQGQGGH